MTTKSLSLSSGTAWSSLRLWWQLIAGLRRKAPRRLRLSETVPLGEHRFVAVIEFEQRRFLLGGTSSSLVLLAQLEENRNETPSASRPIAGEPD